MKKRVVFAVLGLVVVVLLLGGVKALQIGTMIDQGKKFVPPPETVTTTLVKAETWENTLSSVGTLTAVQGVTIAPELAGKVVQIAFQSGAAVRKGDLILRQDTSSEEAQLPGILAQMKLARSSLQRSEKLYADKVVSQADYDSALATYDQARAQSENLRATIEKKTIRAPFSGRLGIRQANLGQILKEGDAIVVLQALDPIFVDFNLPQQELSKVRQGLTVRVTSDALPGVGVEGKISAINPLVDPETRNIKVQATISNAAEKLRPGMFVNVAVALPLKSRVLSLPATAILYAPYSDSVFVIESKGAGKTLRQQFVRLGEKRGDFVAVNEGIKEGEAVAATGVFKLRNGQSVVVDNKLTPDFQKSPKPENK